MGNCSVFQTAASGCFWRWSVVWTQEDISLTVNVFMMMAALLGLPSWLNHSLAGAEPRALFLLQHILVKPQSLRSWYFNAVVCGVEALWAAWRPSEAPRFSQRRCSRPHVLFWNCGFGLWAAESDLFIRVAGDCVCRLNYKSGLQPSFYTLFRFKMWSVVKDAQMVFVHAYNIYIQRRTPMLTCARWLRWWVKDLGKMRNAVRRKKRRCVFDYMPWHQHTHAHVHRDLCTASESPSAVLWHIVWSRWTRHTHTHTYTPILYTEILSF